MQHDQVIPQEEARSAHFRMRLTPGELKDVELLAAFDEETKSEIIRKYRMDEIRTRAAGIRRAGAAATAA